MSNWSAEVDAERIFVALCADIGDRASLTGYTAYPVEDCDKHGEAFATKIGKFMIQTPNCIQVSELKQAWFGGYGWVTLCFTIEDAILEGIASRGRAAPHAATVCTDWVTCRVTLTERQTTACFNANLISRLTRYGLNAWRFKENIPLNLVHHGWRRYNFRKMGYVYWAQKAVGPRTHWTLVLDSAQRAKCQDYSIRTWNSWCARCQNQYHVAREAENKMDDSGDSDSGSS